MRQRWNGGCRSAQAEGYGGLAARTFGARRLADVSFGDLGQHEASARQRTLQPGAEGRQCRARAKNPRVNPGATLKGSRGKRRSDASRTDRPLRVPSIRVMAYD